MYEYPKLLKGKFITRYKRFFTDVETDEGLITAHNPNTGSMKCVLEEGRETFLSLSDNPKRKLPYTVEGFKVDGEWMLTNTILMNRIVKHGFQDGEIEGFDNITTLKGEYKYGDGRIDFYIECDLGRCLVEVKNVTMFDDEFCMFPDAVTERGRKHIGLLMKAKEEGYLPFMLYVCQIKRDKFRIAKEIDSAYNDALNEALGNGLNIITVHTVFDEDSGTVTLERGGEFEVTK